MTPLTLADIEREMREAWAMVEPMPNTLMVSLPTMKVIRRWMMNTGPIRVRNSRGRMVTIQKRRDRWSVTR